MRQGTPRSDVKAVRAVAARRFAERLGAVLAVLVLVFATGGSASAALPQGRPPALLPAAPPVTEETNLYYNRQCIYVPETVSGRRWFMYCTDPGDAGKDRRGQIRLLGDNGDRIWGSWLWQPNIPSGSVRSRWSPEFGTPQYTEAQLLALGWLNKCKDDDMPDELKTCQNVVDASPMPVDKNGNSTDNNQSSSFWEPSGNIDTDNPCEILTASAEGRNANIRCIDPRHASPCPPDAMRKALHDMCKADNKAVMEKFQTDPKSQAGYEGAGLAEESRACTSGGVACNLDLGSDGVTTDLATRDKEFKDAPLEWVEKNLATAAGEVLTWWIQAPDPGIKDDGKVKNEQNYNFIVRHTNVILITLLIAAFIIAAIKVSLEANPQPLKVALTRAFKVMFLSFTIVMIVNYVADFGKGYSDWLLGSLGNSYGGEGGAQAAVDTLKAFTGQIDDLNFFISVPLKLCFIIEGLYLAAIFIGVGAFTPVVAAILVLATAAGATNTAVGQEWMQRCTTTLIAFLLVKPATITVFVAGARVWAPQGTANLTAQDQFRAVVILLLMSLLLPAMVRVIFPMTAAAIGNTDAATTLFGGTLAAGARLVRRG